MAGMKQPADKSHFLLPDLGEGVHEAELIAWKVKPGDTVDEHQTLAEMETDKALVEVPSPWKGVVSETCGEVGDIINVGSVLVRYDIGGESTSNGSPKKQAAGQAKPKQASSSSDDAGESEDAGTVVGNVSGELSIPTRFAERRAESNGTAHSGKALATPAVRRIAREAGVDINRVPGSGRGGRVTASDIETFVSGGGSGAGTTTRTAPSQSRRAAPSEPSFAPVAVSRDGVDETIPFRGVRRKIAESLDRSVKTAVHFTVVDEADVTALDAKRKEYARVLGEKLSLLPFIMIAVCRGLRVHPSLNANVDDEAQEILQKGTINLGCAVDTDHGLMVPVIPRADTLSPVQLAQQVSDIARGCRDRTIERERLSGGTFTISNVGSYGGMFATPIINYPEVGILAAGRAYEKVLTRDGMFYAGMVLPLSMSCDHRVVDGAEGARFLQTVVKLLQNPGTLLQ